MNKYSLRGADGTEHAMAYPKPGGTIPTVRLFVKAVSGRKAIEIDLGSDKNIYIPRVQWLPDGKHLAIERLSRDQKTLDLLLADAATGKTRALLTEKDAYWINLSSDLTFLKTRAGFSGPVNAQVIAISIYTTFPADPRSANSGKLGSYFAGWGRRNRGRCLLYRNRSEPWNANCIA